MERLNDSFTTLAEESYVEFEEKRSLFIGRALRTDDEQAAQDFIKKIKKLHADATHNVFAYTMNKGVLARYSDDGEPQGTSGMPTLDAIRKSGVDNACVVITRYFGGTLLGTGGLVRAYTQALQEALKHCPTAMMKYGKRIQVDTDYNGIGKILYFMGQQGLSQESSEYTDKVRIIVLVPGEEVEHFCKEVTELTAGRSKLEVLEEVFYPVPEK